MTDTLMTAPKREVNKLLEAGYDNDEIVASTIWYRAFAWSRRVLGLRSEGIRWAS